NGTPCDSCYNISENPLFISGPDGNYYLSQIEAGQALQSPCVDAGDSTAYYYGLENYTTRTDLVADTGVVDIGYHYPWGIVVSIDNNILEKPEIYLTNFPNPFSSSTTIFFDLATDLHRLALIKIYNIKGQLVKTLECINRVNAKATRSLYSISWKGSDENDKQLSNGIYLYQLKLDNYKSEIKKMILIR
nr:T9SS type A sorting domain-containing protein [Candidatus Cloacimonadota bacterium]